MLSVDNELREAGGLKVPKLCTCELMKESISSVGSLNFGNTGVSCRNIFKGFMYGLCWLGDVTAAMSLAFE